MRPLLLLGCMAGLFACTQANRPWVERVDVDALEGGEIASLTVEQLRARFLAALSDAKFVVPKPEQKVPAEVKPWRMKLAAGLTEPELEQHTSSIVVVLELRQKGSPETLSIESRARVASVGNDVELTVNALRDALDEALKHVSREGAALIALAEVKDEMLVRKLDDADPAVADASLRLLAQRHHAAALPVLLKRLQSDDLDVVRGVVGLLVELKSPASVNPLVETAHRRGLVFQREIVFAVGAIGGDDAEAYLDLVASGHEDAVLRASAQQALHELRARKKTKTEEGQGQAP